MSITKSQKLEKLKCFVKNVTDLRAWGVSLFEISKQLSIPVFLIEKAIDNFKNNKDYQIDEDICMDMIRLWAFVCNERLFK